MELHCVFLAVGTQFCVINYVKLIVPFYTQVNEHCSGPEQLPCSELPSDTVGSVISQTFLSVGVFFFFFLVLQVVGSAEAET